LDYKFFLLRTLKSSYQLKNIFFCLYRDMSYEPSAMIGYIFPHLV
jgi:hypothetical protein